MALTPKLDLVVRFAATQFQFFNKNKSLSPDDKKQLKTFFLERIINPRLSQVLGQERNETSNLPVPTKNCIADEPFLTAKEVEAWLKIDVKTLYAFAKRKMIPHVRIQRNVRFRAGELQRWVERHSQAPREVRISQKRAGLGAHRALRLRGR